MQAQEDHPGAALDARAPSQETVGSTLRAARLRLGEELSGVANVLRIRAPFLQAIEDGHFEALPGLPYAIGFVRTYAEHLGLDGAELVRRFKTEAAGLERKTNLSFPSPAPEGRVPGTAALLISLVAATVVFGGWYFYQSGAERFVLRVPEVPERLAPPPPAVVADTPADTQAGGSAAAPAPASQAPASQVPPVPAAVPTPPGQTAALAPPPAAVAPQGAPPAAAPSAARPGAQLGTDAALPPPPGDPTRRLAAVPPPAAAPAAPSAAAPSSEAEDGPPPDPTALGAAPPANAGPGAIPPVPQVAAAPTDGRVFGAQNENSRVVIKARGESWVQIRDATNTPLLTRVLRPGDSYRVPNQAGLVMMTGNAGVLDVVVDGNSAPALGAVGQVRRNIALDADRLRTGTAGAQ